MTTESRPRGQERRGSRARCLKLTEGSCQEVAARLSELIVPFGRVEAGRDFWMPCGAGQPEEAKLGECARFLGDKERKLITSWWLTVPRRANTPNWDLASSATIDGSRGFVLVEAKAHGAELHIDGKNSGRLENHERIGAAIQEASTALNQVTAGWNLSRDKHYQLANRFAWSWKVATLGYPVILVYLGFLKADEMGDIGEPFADSGAWEKKVRQHAAGIVPDKIWGEKLVLGKGSLRPLIRSWNLPL